MKTLLKAKQMLPKWARGLGKYAVTAIALRGAVLEELEAYHAGGNPLEPKQVKALEAWLEKPK